FGRVVPGGVAQRRGRHVLGQPVQLGRDQVVRVGDLRPVRIHHRVGGTAEQDRLGPAEPSGDDGTEIFVGEGNYPPAVGEAAGGVLVCAPGALHDPVGGEEFVNGELHGFSWGGEPARCRFSTVVHERPGAESTPGQVPGPHGGRDSATG